MDKHEYDDYLDRFMKSLIYGEAEDALRNIVRLAYLSGWQAAMAYAREHGAED